MEGRSFPPWRVCDEAKEAGWLTRARLGLHCTLFCGGVKCKHEDWLQVRDKKNVHIAIEGLNSSWVSDCIVASQRPSSSLFLKHEIVAQFKAKHVTGVFNLQEKGEHASCGPDGIYAATGYSYNGEEDLMRHGVHYYEFPWPDMTSPDNDVVLRSVLVMDFHMRSSGKVLVHCHAGLGRTGLMIVCYFILCRRMSAADAVELVRAGRPGAVQTAGQMSFCCAFEQHVLRLMQAFRVEISDAPITLSSFLRRQKLVLHGEESRHYRYVPKHIHRVLCRLIELIQSGRAQGEEAHNVCAIAAVEALSPAATLAPGVAEQMRGLVNNGGFDPRNERNTSKLAFLCIDWFRCLSEPVLGEEQVSAVLSFMRKPAHEREAAGVASATSAFPKNALLTVHVLLSALFIIGNHITPPHRRFALQCIVDALHHFHDPARMVNSPAEHFLICDFYANVTQYVKNTLFFGEEAQCLTREGVQINIASKALLCR